MDRGPVPLEAPESVTLQAPAKVNLCLEVLGRRPDGYHDLRTLMAPVSLYDTLRVQRVLEPGRIRVAVDGSPRGVAGGEENLCHVAARFYFSETGVAGGASIELAKKIPVGAGLGGGSSDAAVTILGLEHLYGVPLSPESRTRAAFLVGADVPFFFARGPAWVTGIGEQVAPLPECQQVWLVLVYPGVFLSTPMVFSRFRRGLTSPIRPPTIAQFNFRGLAGRLFNDLQAPAVAAEPVVGEVLGALGTAGATEQLMSGSGSAVFGVFDHAATARAAAARLEGHPRAVDWQIEVVSTLPPGAFPFPAG